MGKEDEDKNSGRPPASNSGDSKSAAAGADVDAVRRRLLRLGGYAVPAIVGSLMLSRDALAQAASCGPANCFPNGSSSCGPASCPPRR